MCIYKKTKTDINRFTTTKLITLTEGETVRTTEYPVYIIIIIIIIIWTLQHSVACDDIKIVVKVAERNADRQHQNRVVKLRTIYM